MNSIGCIAAHLAILGKLYPLHDLNAPGMFLPLGQFFSRVILEALLTDLSCSGKTLALS
ncbi:MAG: hypothetical protein KUG81_10950 [Gammaproteobacteria bacterium]|nr:hypothetical protein [Gammaproteobacteria bacterium]